MIIMNTVNSTHSTMVMSMKLNHKKKRITSKAMSEFRKYFVCKSTF